jgi:hypothetical protein
MCLAVRRAPSVKERPREGTAGVAAEAEAHRGASGAGDRKRTARGAGPAEMHAGRVGWGDAVPGERRRHTARVTTDAVGGWRGPLSLPRWAPTARDVDELYLFWDGKAKRSVYALRVRRQPRCSWWWCGSWGR